MVADLADHLIGVDTHRDDHSAAFVTAATGVVDAQTTVPANVAGYRKLLWLARSAAPGRRLWAIEGTGSYGAGLMAYLQRHGEAVVEVERPRRREGQASAPKSDELDAIAAARHVLGAKHLAWPRARGEREALRVLLTTRHSAVRSRVKAIQLLKGLIVSAPEGLRRKLRGLPTADQLIKCSRLRAMPHHSCEHRSTVIALRSTAQRALALEAEAHQLEDQLHIVVAQTASWLLSEPGVGPITAAQLLVSWSHAGRFHSEAAFARLAGAAPLPASSGQTIRHRYDPGGDRQLNRALYTIALCRMRADPRTRHYVARRRSQGKTDREIRRCLKRYTARHLYRLLQQHANPPNHANTDT